MNKSDIFWQTYLNLEREAIDVSKYVFFTDEKTVISRGVVLVESCNTQLETFSPYIADLLIRCCVQIEAIAKELYFDNGGTKERGDNTILFDEDCLKLIDTKWDTHNKRVLVVAPFFNFTKEENKVLRPLKEAHKRQGTYWEKAYQAVKHDRYSSLHKGNIKAFIQALAALYLLNLYYRNDSWITKYEEISKKDYSMGSSLFAVKPPIANQLWEDNNPVMSDSPYVVSYIEKDYQQIVRIRDKEEQALKDYISEQPELKEPAFVEQLHQSVERDPTQRIMIIWELAKYRLNKKIPTSLPFDEKKKRLISSQEWNGWIHTHNKHLTADELTPDNIQQEIDSVGTLWGMELMKQFQKLEWLPLALKGGICRVYIP